MNAKSAMGRTGLMFAVLAVSLGVVVPRGFPQVLTAVPDEVPTARWSDIKNDTYDQRAHFAAGLAHLSDRLNSEIRMLNAKRAGMTTDTKEWDFAMKAVEDSRALLTGRMNELGQATTPETWAEAKDNVGDAWHRARLAVDNMHTTVTT